MLEVGKILCFFFNPRHVFKATEGIRGSLTHKGSPLNVRDTLWSGTGVKVLNVSRVCSRNEARKPLSDELSGGRGPQFWSAKSQLGPKKYPLGK